MSLVGVTVLGVALWLATLAIGGRDSADLKLGDQTFKGGKTSRIAAEIADRGPILYGDVSGRKDRDMILQHRGKDPEKGWTAFLASPIDKPRDCMWEWQADEEIFRAACDRTLTAPADGEGLPQFAVRIDDGRINVDLNADARTTTTTTTTGSGSGG